MVIGPCFVFCSFPPLGFSCSEFVLFVLGPGSRVGWGRFGGLGGLCPLLGGPGGAWGLVLLTFLCCLFRKVKGTRSFCVPGAPGLPLGGLLGGLLGALGALWGALGLPLGSGGWPGGLKKCTENRSRFSVHFFGAPRWSVGCLGLPFSHFWLPFGCSWAALCARWVAQKRKVI